MDDPRYWKDGNRIRPTPDDEADYVRLRPIPSWPTYPPEIFISAAPLLPIRRSRSDQPAARRGVARALRAAQANRTSLEGVEPHHGRSQAEAVPQEVIRPQIRVRRGAEHPHRDRVPDAERDLIR